MRLRNNILLPVLALSLAAAAAWAGPAVVETSGTQVSLQNAQMRITFDMARGTYSALRLADQKIFIQNAYSQAGSMTSLAGCRFAHLDGEFQDAIGAGRKLRLRGNRPGGPDLLIEFSLYHDHGFFTVSAGALNTTSASLQIKEFYPLRAESAHQGAVFLGPDPARDHRVLTGEGDTWCPRLLGQLKTKSSNVALITYLRRPEKESLVLGGLTTNEFMHRVNIDAVSSATATSEGRRGIDAWVRTWDPAGKRIEPGKDYLPDPAYVDFSESNPYFAMERYAQRVARAMKVRLAHYDAMAPVCLWYLSSTSVGENTAAGGLREARLMKDIGLAAYAPPLVRLVPNTPANPNEQLWWDDEHWRRGGYLQEPVETVAKWVKAMRESGAGCELALQPALVSADYAAAHPGQMLFNDAKKLPDVTDPELERHLRGVFRRLKDDGVRGLFFDYCGSLLLGAEGGFENPAATAVSAYRRLFALVKEECGPDFLITENPNGRTTAGAEVATGVIDAKRSETDKVTLTPQVVRRGVREWYRNRTTKLIDPDVKNLDPFDGDVLRAQVTALATMFGKTMLGSSVTRYTPEAIHTLGRILPMPADAATARPIGLFAATDDEAPAPNPEIYECPLGGQAHLLLYWNHSGVREKAIAAPLGGDTAFGGTGLDETLAYDVWDYWDWQDMGRLEGGSTLAARVRPGEMKTMVLHPVQKRPYVLATTRHLLPAMGVAEERWDAGDRILRGKFHVIGGDPLRAVIKVPAGGLWVVSEYKLTGLASRGAKVECRTDLMGEYVELTVRSESTRDLAWAVDFTVKKEATTGNPGTPQGLSAAVIAAEGCVQLKWEASHRVDDRAVRYQIYRHTTPDFTPGLVNRICETIRTTASDPDVRPGQTYYYRVIAEDSNGNRSKAASAEVSVAPTYSRALLNRIDAATGGNWKGNYGEEGYMLFNVVSGNRNKVHLPSYVESVSYRGEKGSYPFTMGTDEARALAYSDETTRTRRLGALASFHDLYLEVKVTDTALHALSLYFVNWEGLERRFIIEPLDQATRRPLAAPYELADFKNGKYVQYLFRGSISIRISRPETSNGVVLSGLFLDDPRIAAPEPFKTERPLWGEGGETRFAWAPTPGASLYRLTVSGEPGHRQLIFDDSGWETARTVPGLVAGRTYYWKVEASGIKGSATNEGGLQSFTAAPAAGFAGFDDTTLGGWRTRHGKAGYLLPAANAADWSDQKQLPAFIESVSTAGSQYFKWANTGRKETPAAPEPPDGKGERDGAAVFDHWHLTVDIKARDTAEHTVSFYNWLGAIYPGDGMDAWIEVVDPDSGQVLDRRYDRRLADGPEGRYFTYRFQGRLVVRLRNVSGAYCFLNGIFWEK